jgi:predicted nucleotidyltransferase
LLAAYAHGSLARGGFSELVSDIDLGLIVSDPLLPDDAETIQAVAETETPTPWAAPRRLAVALSQSFSRVKRSIRFSTTCADSPSE